jgi:hypothetical protein
MRSRLPADATDAPEDERGLSAAAARGHADRR